MEALSAAKFAGRLAAPGADVLEVARAASAAPQPLHAPSAADLLLAGLTVHHIEGYAAGLPVLREALAAFGRGMSVDDELRWLYLASVAALHVWDHDRWYQLLARFVRLARAAGSLSELPFALTARVFALLSAGELAAAAALADELEAVAEATGASRAPFTALGLAALRGDEGAFPALFQAVTRDAGRRGEGYVLTVAGWAEAILGNGLGQFQQALAAAQDAVAYEGNLGASSWAMAELVEAATRSGDDATAAGALARLAGMTSAAGTGWALGIEARCRALLSEGEAAERLYRESVERLVRTRLHPDLARAHLLYGEWLRRERCRTEAREQLRTAHSMLKAMGVEAFAERARGELQATGETARRRPAATGIDELTAHEAQIARLARDGLTNPEIGARLFLSARTVQYHLGNIFAKLGISSRSQLDRVLPGERAAV